MTRDTEIKNKLTVTRGERGGDNGGKGNPSAPLVGMQNGEATVENNMEFPQKTKNETAL